MELVRGLEEVNMLYHFVSQGPDPDGDTSVLAETGLVESTTWGSALNATSTESAPWSALAKRAEDNLKKTSLSQQDLVATQELESLKQIATQQEEIIANQSLAYLRNLGYGLHDLAAWRWILDGKTAEDAATRLAILMKPPIGMSDDFAPVPIFVFSRLLLRIDMNRRALALLLRQSWQILGWLDQRKLEDNREITLQPTSPQRSLHSTGLDALVVLVVRFLRHARRVWPAACVDIAQLWNDHARVGQVIRPTKQNIMTERDAARLSFCYNRILSLLALPPNESPFQSLHHRQRAQFMVIRQMNAFNPPLAITREGYRAVSRVQLAHRKTDGEQKWARLKAKSWPPWKEDKLGVDAFIGVEQGISRASDSLRLMAEMGYGPLDWEKSAGILAGWDTDGSPTIQTRSTIVPRSSLHREHRKGKKGLRAEGDGQRSDADAIWAARIRATRTLQEAWTCFLICKDQKASLTSLIYHAIFEKVIFEEKRNRGVLHSNRSLHAITEEKMPLPGDGREVFGSSTSHNQAISTREPLPMFDTLLNRMVDDQIRPSGRFLALLLGHARTFDEGVKILEASDLSNSTKKVLLVWREPPVPDVESQLRRLPDWLFAAYIGFLCRFAYVRQRKESPLSQDHRTRTQEIYAAVLLLRHAFKLVTKRRPFYLPPWILILKLLARAKAVVVVKKVSLHPYAQAIPKFHRACRLLEYMDAVGLDLDFAGFKQFCKVFNNSVVFARHILSTSDDNGERSMAQALLKDGLFLAKTRFWRIVQTPDNIRGGRKPFTESSRPLLEPAHGMEQTRQLPTQGRIPHPANLHNYIRLLGQYPDYEGLVDLVRWMSTVSEAIVEEARESYNGATAMRTCVTAIRAFVEQPLAAYTVAGNDADKGSEQYETSSRRLETVRTIIESNELWGGWPTDEELGHLSFNGNFSQSIRLSSKTVIRSSPTHLYHGPEAPRLLTTTAGRRNSQQLPQDTSNENIVENQRAKRLISVSNVPAPHIGHIRIFTLKSPHNKNAISQQLLGELYQHIQGLKYTIEDQARAFERGGREAYLGNGTRAIIIQSEVDGVFCAGADLKERKNMTEYETIEFLNRLRETLDLLQGLYIPTISAVSSVALGGGLELALATDFRVFTPATLVGLPETRLGIIPGAGGAPRLLHLLGKSRALDIILTGRRIQGEEAMRIGLCDRLCGPSLEHIRKEKIDDSALRQHASTGALEMAQEICEGGPATTLPLLQLMKSPSPETYERKAYGMVLKTQDRNEALQAFAEKRKPVFKGK
ncbi:MAG: hypothetical protein Q9211_003429 [Gyalolechia sp. 1 TL-2023]